MRQMGCTGAQTIHSSIYRPVSELVAEAKSLKACHRNAARLRQDGCDREVGDTKWGTTDPLSLERKLMALRDRIENRAAMDFARQHRPGARRHHLRRMLHGE